MTYDPLTDDVDDYCTHRELQNAWLEHCFSCRAVAPVTASVIPCHANPKIRAGLSSTGVDDEDAAGDWGTLMTGARSVPYVTGTTVHRQTDRPHRGYYNSSFASTCLRPPQKRLDSRAGLIGFCC